MSEKTDELRFSDIPGTFVQDAERSRRGYHLNMFAMSLAKAENRARFQADERAYLEEFPLSPEQRDAVLARDWDRMLELGGNVFFLGKLATYDGLSYQQLAALMAGMRQDDYAQMMLGGGRRAAEPAAARP